MIETKQELFDRFWQFYYEKHNEDYDKAAEAIPDLRIV